MGITPQECFRLANENELRPGELLNVHMAEHWRTGALGVHDDIMTAACPLVRQPGACTSGGRRTIALPARIATYELGHYLDTGRCTH